MVSFIEKRKNIGTFLSYIFLTYKNFKIIFASNQFYLLFANETIESQKYHISQSCTKNELTILIRMIYLKNCFWDINKVALSNIIYYPPSVFSFYTQFVSVKEYHQLKLLDLTTNPGRQRWTSNDEQYQLLALSPNRYQ